MKKNTLRKNLILKKDYERYTVHLPLKMILRHGYKRFLFSELQKRHPCFSEDCSFDSKVKFGKNGLKSDVVVMNRLKLLEYRNRGRSLFIEENNRKKVFRSEKISARTFSLALMILLAGGFLITCGLWKLMENSPAVEDKTPEKPVSEKTVESADAMKAGELLQEFLSVMDCGGGRILELEWKSSGLQESFSAAVKLIYPEAFEGSKEKITAGNVSYKLGKPQMTVQGEGRIAAGNWLDKTVERNGTDGAPMKVREAELQKMNADVVHFSLSDFRKLIGNFGAEIAEEKDGCKIMFVLRQVSVFKMERFIEEMWNFSLSENVGIERFLIKMQENGSVLFSVDFARGLEVQRGVQLGALKKKMALFETGNERKRADGNASGGEAVAAKLPLAAGRKVEKRKEAGNEADGRQKIGEIWSIEGIRWIYYRSAEGKVIRERAGGEM